MEAILKREVIVARTACRALGIAVFVVLTALGAFVRIPLPFTTVPVTLQTFFVLLGAAFLGRRLGTVSQLSYIALGALGLPMFTAAGSGLFYLAGPTAGYLFGFVLASIWLGSAFNSKRSFGMNFILFSAASSLILFSGSVWLKLILGLSWPQAFFIGFVPFVAGDLLKSFAAAAVYAKLGSRAKEIIG